MVILVFIQVQLFVLLKDDWTTPFATRVFGVVPLELRKNGYLKIISLSFRFNLKDVFNYWRILN